MIDSSQAKPDTGVGGASLLPPPAAPVSAWDCISGDSGLISMESSTNSVDSVSSQLSSGLKLTEQQNTNIDAQRLSAVVNVFDPLSQGSDGSAGDRSESSSGAEGSGTPEHVFTPRNKPGKESVNREVYDKQGARPKVTPGGQFLNNNPKIQLQVNDQDVKREGEGGYQAVRFTVEDQDAGLHMEGKNNNNDSKVKVNGEVIVTVETDSKFDSAGQKKGPEETGSGRKSEVRRVLCVKYFSLNVVMGRYQKCVNWEVANAKPF